SVSPKLSIARAALPMFSPSCGRTRTMTGRSAFATGISDRARKFLEVARFAEVAIDAGETDVRDAVELAQAVHHHFPDARRGDLAFSNRFDLALDARNQLVDPFLPDAALAAGEGDRLLDLATLERLALAAALDHHDLAQLHAFEGSEARATALALASPPDCRVILGGAGVFYLTFVVCAERAAHSLLTLDPAVKRNSDTGQTADDRPHERQDPARHRSGGRADQHRLGRDMVQPFLGHADD